MFGRTEQLQPLPCTLPGIQIGPCQPGFGWFSPAVADAEPEVEMTMDALTQSTCACGAVARRGWVDP